MLPKSKQWWDSPRTRGTKFSIEIKIPFLLRQERGTTPTRSNRSYRDFRFAIDSALPLLQHFPQAKLSSLSKVERWLDTSARYPSSILSILPRKRPRGSWKKFGKIVASMPLDRGKEEEEEEDISSGRSRIERFLAPSPQQFTKLQNAQGYHTARREAGVGGGILHTRGLGAWTRGRNRVMMRERYISRDHARPYNSLPLTKIPTDKRTEDTTQNWHDYPITRI